MRILLLGCIALGLMSCGNAGKNSPANNDTAAKASQLPVEIYPVPIRKKDFPAGIGFNGVIQEAWRFTDKTGDNIFFTTEVAPHQLKTNPQTGEYVMGAELYGYLYTAGADSQFKQVWKLEKMVRDCEFDLTFDFIKGATTITDLDKNGIAEIKLQYISACRSDVSPAEIVLEMHEGKNAYTLRGNSWVKPDDTMTFSVTPENADLSKAPDIKDELQKLYYSFGRYDNERAFAKAPAPFLPYARTEWIKHVKEQFGE